MGVIKWARMAIRWLTKRATQIKEARLKAQEVARIITEGTKYQIAYERFCEKMAVVESTYGATTMAWKTIQKAKKGDEVVITANDAEYLRQFKKTFDQTLKK